MKSETDDESGGDDDSREHDSDGHVAFAQLFDLIETGCESIENLDDNSERNAHGQSGYESPGEGSP